jgi:hypothetical protein
MVMEPRLTIRDRKDAVILERALRLYRTSLPGSDTSMRRDATELLRLLQERVRELAIEAGADPGHWASTASGTMEAQRCYCDIGRSHLGGPLFE